MRNEKPERRFKMLQHPLRFNARRWKQGVRKRRRGHGDAQVDGIGLGLPRWRVLAALLRQAQFFQPLGLFPASPLLRLDGFLGGSLGVFKTILPISL
ncbi:hypothetical protein [Rhizobium phaseoli]|uniref:hypothetical protein n=1 Tax=Rhizobium phaseoli TaxID=396 RepID=UPI001484FF9B|nr:hypothetical protein [Rhizobium phaseoli]